MSRDQQIQAAKLRAIYAARDCALRIRLGDDKVRPLFEAIWEVVEREWPRHPPDAA